MIVAWSNLLVGILLVAVSVPLWMGAVPMNKWYGVRLPQSYESDEAWYRINRFGGWTGVICGLLIAAVGVLCFVRPPETQAMQLLLAFAGPLLVVPWAVVCFLYASRL